MLDGADTRFQNPVAARCCRTGNILGSRYVGGGGTGQIIDEEPAFAARHLAPVQQQVTVFGQCLPQGFQVG
nr:hypothetical protein [Roseomonas genomospecies 6]